MLTLNLRLNPIFDCGGKIKQEKYSPQTSRSLGEKVAIPGKFTRIIKIIVIAKNIFIPVKGAIILSANIPDV